MNDPCGEHSEEVSLHFETALQFVGLTGITSRHLTLQENFTAYFKVSTRIKLL